MITKRQRQLAQSMKAGGARACDIARALHISQRTARRLGSAGHARHRRQPVRCPGCGGSIIETPCRLCAVRSRSQAKPRCPSKSMVNSSERRKLDLPLSYLLSARTANCLATAEILTVHDLLMRRREELRAISGVGPKILDEVVAALARIGFVPPKVTSRAPTRREHATRSRPKRNAATAMP